jgi:hypothetical protein
MNNVSIPLYLKILFSVGMLIICFRIFINFSLNIIPIVFRNYYEEIGSFLLTVPELPEVPENIPKNHKDTNNPKFFNIFSKHHHTHHTYYRLISQF